MKYFGCFQCGEARTEYEIRVLGETQCRACQSNQIREAARPLFNSFSMWLRHPIALLKLLNQERKFNAYFNRLQRSN